MANKNATQVYVFYGPEEYLKKEALDKLRAAVGMPDVVEANTTVLRGQGLTLQLLQEAASAVPFLAERRLVIVEGLLTHMEEQQNARPRGRGARTQKSDADQWDSLPQFLTRLPPTTILVFLDGVVRKTNSLLQTIASAAEVRDFQAPKDGALRRWIRERVSQAGATITPRAASALADLVGGNLWALHGEVEKLALYASGRAIDERDVEALVSSSQTNIFRAVDAVLAGQTGLAMQLLDGLRQGGAEVGYIFTMIARQLRFVLVAQELTEAGVQGDALTQRLGIRDFALRTVQEQARKHPPLQIEAMFRKLMEADLAIKTGQLEEKLALETLVVELAQTGGTGRKVTYR